MDKRQQSQTEREDVPIGSKEKNCPRPSMRTACGNELMKKKECEEGQEPRQRSRRQWWGSVFWARKQESQHWLESWCYQC